MPSTVQGEKQSEAINIRKRDYIILIIGASGAGKSAFINNLCGWNVVKVADSLNPCTTEFKPVEIPEATVRARLTLWRSLLPRPGAKLVVVDTPGLFDDTVTGKSEVLKSVRYWLAKSVRGAKLAGIIYLHDIRAERAEELAKWDIQPFTKLCGEDPRTSAVLGTTQWENHKDDERTIKKREEELQSIWDTKIGKASKMLRVYDQRTNLPWDLIKAVLDKGESPTYIIPIMGPSGAGKSTFINELCGWDVVKVGDSLSSCTTDLKPVEVPEAEVREHLPLWESLSPRPGTKLIIVDTPGFDDTSADDSEILKRIADWLANKYGANARLTGIIYLQDICQRRVTGATKRNFEVFDKLCGENACKSVVLGTTQWANVPKEEMAIAIKREREYTSIFWSGMIAKGSTMQRVDDKATNASPWDLILAVFSKNESPTLLIQQELTELHRSLPQTEAGRVLRERIEGMVKSMKNAGATKQELQAYVREIQALKEKSRIVRFFASLFS